MRLDVDAAQLRKNTHADVVLHGDAAATLTALCTLLPAGADGHARAAELRAACRKEALVDGGPVRRGRGRGARRRCPPTGSSPATGRRSPTSAPCTCFDLSAPRWFCYTPGFATLGYGLPAAIGAAIGRARPAGRRACSATAR